MALHTPVRDLQPPARIAGMEILETRPLPDRAGQYPSVAALLHRDEMPEHLAYATLIVYFNDDHDEWAACWGHYDLTRAAAEADFQQRSA